MKWVVLANNVIRKEMQQKCAGADISIIYVSTIEAMLVEHDVDAYFDLDFSFTKKRVEELKTLLPKIVFINSVVCTLQEIGLPFVRINAWPGFLERNCFELSVLSEEQQSSIIPIMQAIKSEYRIVPDVPGMLSARIVVMIINEAYFTLQEGVSDKAGIDLAMKLGTSYPYGPFEWAKKIGLKNVVDLLYALGITDKRYEIAKNLEIESNNIHQ
jgi:3-hydroxybutyryl-CoA dehydrogenase